MSHQVNDHEATIPRLMATSETDKLRDLIAAIARLRYPILALLRLK
jgi:hypothetical protein